ncbi:hypothetical protein ELH42_08590 [Rhizobium ruizarguesonis]|uniref:Uncharacterized protein n=1 Tax=Rhizobium ruizarguesonis TaxID=2081791 RepID=A0AB38I4L4_9HYPH|nr:hypothetical protein ELH42_08590 [Rhizobium ruizarguesonis]TBB70604.1 hypothetical protein ELH45_08640 [Rhizobium ruizarguesonis]TBC15634.1 hypothetical protein ELH40_12205 [Rhizobium ruizarguesonis]
MAAIRERAVLEIAEALGPRIAHAVGTAVFEALVAVDFDAKKLLFPILDETPISSTSLKA